MSDFIASGRLSGTVQAVASKSYAHRLYICAALSDEPTKIICENRCSDIMSTISCLKALGADIDGDRIIPIDRGKLPAMPVLDCHDSGSTLRFLIPVIAALGYGAEFSVSEGLSKRPMTELTEALRNCGAEIEGLKVLPSILSCNEFQIPGNISSQYISGLLMALPILGGGKVYITNKLQSSNYVDITIDCLRQSKIYVNQSGDCIEIKGAYNLTGEHIVEGDWSSAAFWLCAGVLGDAPITVRGLNLASLQGDRKIVAVLRNFGADIRVSDNAVTAYPSQLKATEIDASDIPDLVPILSLVCALADGNSRIYNAERLRFKESDRLKSVNVMLTELGANLEELADGLIIHGVKKLHGCSVDSFSDHRIAMTAAIASTLCDGAVKISDFDCIEKSYPDFKRDFLSLGGELREQL